MQRQKEEGQESLLMVLMAATKTSSSMAVRQD